MGRYRESRTGIAVLAFIVASAAAQFNSPADLRGDCSDKTDGIYPTGHCSTYFLECSGGATTKQNCSDGLWFNPLTSQCDYREKIAACQDAFSCVGREDGVYGEGCSSMFWYCTGGQLKHTTCNTGLFFNVETQKCDYRGNIRACGGSSKTSSPSKTRSHRLTTVTSTTASTAVPLTTVSPTTVSPTTMNTEQARMVGRDWTEVPYGQTYPTYPPRQRISGTVSKTPLAESSAGTACAGKEDGSHEKEECSSQYVLCWAGTGQVMNCPSSLMFNKENGQCDYPLNVAGCTGSSSVSLEGAVPSLSSPPGYGSGSSPLVSAAPSSASLPIPRQPVEMDCSGRSDGEYALSPCTRHYFQCVSGSAYTRSCNKGLVYNPANNQCDHKKNCGLASSSVVAADAPTTVIPVTSTTKTSIGLDCSSLSDGLYSRGCVTEYSQCAAGIFYLRKCPGGLVFDDVTKACDYPEICSAPSTIPQDILPSGYSRPSTTVSPTTAATVTFDCSSRVDGLYSDGCISWYLECSSGVATPFQCPSGLVFDGVNHKCDYADKCGQPRPLEHDPSDYSQSQSIPSTHPTHSILAQSTPIAFDCSSRVDGLYGNGCSPLFYQCVSGMAVSQSCPTGLMFHQKTRGCEYKCEGEEGVEEAVVEDATMPPVKPTLTHPSIDCYNRPDGLYSSGCSRSFVQCVNGLVFDRLCPEGLVFLQESGRCEYPSSCGSVPWMGASPVSLPLSLSPSTSSSAPYHPSFVNEATTTATPLPPKRDAPSGVLIDCTTLPDGQYTSGCTHAFVQCVTGAAYPMECQAGLVFDQTVLKCVWPGECSSSGQGVTTRSPLPSLPIVSMPYRPTDSPSTIYDMKKEKEEMVTDAPLPVVSNDGTVCTGTGRRSMGKCSSGFVQCIGGKLIARRCPGQSLFDEKIGLCVYDLDGCEMDVDVVDVNEQETTVAASAAQVRDSSTGYGTQQMEAPPLYPEETLVSIEQTVYQQSPHSPQWTEKKYQNGYETVYPPTSQDGQYERGEYQSVPLSPYNPPIYSSFDDSSLPSQSIPFSPECEIGSFRRVSACSPSFHLCSPTARQWISKVCGKSHRFDSSTNRCRPIFEIRECDEPMSSYVPPPVQSDIPALYPDPATSFQYGVPLSGREYQEKDVVDPFKGGYQSGRMGSNPFMAVGKTGSFYTEDGFRWIGSARSEGGGGRRGGRRQHKHGHHSGNYVIVSGNPFGEGRDMRLNDEWKGRRDRDGPVRSSLKAVGGHRVSNVVDTFKGHVSHFAPPLGAVNPFAVKRADGHRRRGRKSCRRDRHGRREDWEDEDCEEKRREEDEDDEGDEDERDMEEEESMEDNGNREIVEESSHSDGRPIETQSHEKENEEIGEETEEGETDPELMPESIENEEAETEESKVEETEKEENKEVKEDEKMEEMEEIEETPEEDEENEEGKEEVEENEEVKEDDETIEDNEEPVETEENGDEGKEEEKEASEAMEEPEEKEEEIEEEPEVKEHEVTPSDEPVESEENGEEEEDASDMVEQSEEKEEIEEEQEEEEETEETTTEKGPLEEIEEKKNEEMEDEDDEEIRENEEAVEDGENVEEKVESETGEIKREAETESGVDDLNEDDVDQEFEQDGENESDDESKTDDIESPEGLEKEEKEEKTEVKEDEKMEENEETENTSEVDEEIEENEENGEGKEEVEGDETEKNEDVKEDEETPSDDIEEPVETEENGDENVEASEMVEQSEKNEEIEEEDEEKEVTEETTTENGPLEEIEEKKNEEMEDEDDDDDEEMEENVAVVEDGENVEEKRETLNVLEQSVNGEKEEVKLDEDEKVEENEEMEEPEENEENGDEGKEETEEGETDPELPEAIEKEEETTKRDEIEENEEEMEEEEEENDPRTEQKEGVGIEMNFVENGGKTEKEEKMEKNPEENGEAELEMNPESLEGEGKEEEEEENVEVNEDEDNEDSDPEDGPESIEKEEGEDEMATVEKRRRRRSIVYDPSLSVSSQSSLPRRLSLPRSSRLHRSRFSRLCVSSSNGQTISIGQCRQDFVYCKSARRPVVAACPVGDLFDAVMSTCVPTEMCGAEMVKTPSAPLPSMPYSPTASPRDGINPTLPSPSPVSPSHQTPFVAKDTDCSSLSDGAYPLSDCSPHYFVCSATRKYEYSCPGETVFDKPTDACVWPREVSACAVASSSPSTPMSDSPSIYSGLATTSPSTISPMHVHFKCEKDGGFSIDCKGGFVMCSNGAASFMKCPHALTFDETTQACQYPGHVGSCGVAPIGSLDVATSAPYSPSPSPSSPYSPSTTFTPTRAVEVLVNKPVDKDACRGVSSGVDGATRECPSSFVICIEGRVTAVMNCAEGTFFNHKTKNCDYREIACAGGWSGEAHGVESPVEEDVPVASPVTVIETEEYGRRVSRPYRPSMPVEVEKIEKKEEEVMRYEKMEQKAVVVPSTVEATKDASCDWKGAAASGECSSQFITCSNGRPEVFDCSAGLVFASSSSACEYPEFVSGCLQLKDVSPISPPYSTSPTPSTSPSPSPSPYSPSTAYSISDTIMVDESSSSSPSSSEYTRDETPSTTLIPPLVPAHNGDHTSAKFEATGDHCTFVASQPSFPLNYCSMTYAVCTSQGLAYRTNCTFGFLFDSVIRRCVPSEHCGQPYMKEIGGVSASATLSPISVADWNGDSRCVGMADGTLKATALCSGQYIRCQKESVVLQSCSDAGRVFSALTGRCVLKVQMAECSSSSPHGPTPAITRPKIVSPPSDPSLSPSSPVTYSTALPSPSHRGARIRGGLPIYSSSTQFDARSFCTTKHTDGLYRNPANCAGIVQCFGGEAFSYPSCAPGLFFNEVDGQCDYASNIPECASQADSIALDDSSASCKGQPHGAHLADDSDCSIYYRCVWGSLERLSCPEGTVFNPRLSVCDYPSEVPHCQKQ